MIRPLIATLALGLLTGCGASSLDGGGPAALTLGNAPEDTTLQTGSVTPSSRTGLAAVRRVADQATQTTTPGTAAYRVGPLDVLEINVFKVPDLSKTLQVSEAGTINYPLIGSVAATGRTAREIETDITERLGRDYLQNPQVSVQVTEFNSQRVTVEGAVKKPGVYPIRGGLTLLQAIATAQGLEATAETTVLVFRTEDGKRQGAKFDLTAIRDGSTRDPQLQAGDVIVANTSATQKAFDNFLKIVPAARFFLLI